MNFADQKMVKKLRKEFPVGCRIVLDEMDDRQAPPIGTQGTCNGVDDAGNILVSWDTGSHLNVAYGADSCHRVASEAEVKVSLVRLGIMRQTGPRCPRCGAKPDCFDHLHQALSRRADIHICYRCGPGCGRCRQCDGFVEYGRQPERCLRCGQLPPCGFGSRGQGVARSPW